MAALDEFRIVILFSRALSLDARAIAEHLRDKVIEPEHLLLSLLGEEIGMAYEVLDIIGVDRAELRAEVMKARVLQKQEKQRKAKKQQRGGSR